METVLRDVELGGCRRADVVVSDDGLIAAVGKAQPRTGDQVIDGRGGALLPGLADRHLHLMALAAARDSVDCGPPRVRTREDLARALRTGAATVPPGAWVRGIGYHESVTGPLDRALLDALVPDRAVRVQHRGGALWTVNSAGARLLGLDPYATGSYLTGLPYGIGSHGVPDGVETDAAGRVTGRLWRLDGWLRARLGPPTVPDLATLGRLLASYGVTAVTDATPDLGWDTVDELAKAVRDGRLPQRLTLLGTGMPPPGPADSGGDWEAGPRKLQPPDHDPWPYDVLLDRVRAARASGPGGRRPVAVHCVTRESLVLTLVALQEIGPVPGDRIEHAAVVPPEVLPLLRELGVRVVTQPAFVAERGDAYRADVDPADLPHLYPYASLLDAGIPVTASSDAPYGSADPWAWVRAARDRSTPEGHVLGAAERVPPGTTLPALFSRPTIRPGDWADLCLLSVPWADALAAPDAGLVRGTWCRGRRVYEGEGVLG
ncbi:amidohydrolase family protein [Streptomyces sp. NPDC058001]|uniref:amidohydrolase family protein n=1 Tax=Streptomyces sp. NPDC058001 TaxID=3346300 RepID=UPI0036E09166